MRIKKLANINCQKVTTVELLIKFENHQCIRKTVCNVIKVLCLFIESGYINPFPHTTILQQTTLNIFR